MDCITERIDTVSNCCKGYMMKVENEFAIDMVMRDIHIRAQLVMVQNVGNDLRNKICGQLHHDLFEGLLDRMFGL